MHYYINGQAIPKTISGTSKYDSDVSAIGQIASACHNHTA
jgi:hypothetical protein